MEAEALLIFALFLVICVTVLMFFVLLTVLRDNREMKRETAGFFHETIEFIKLMTELHEHEQKKDN